MRTRHVELQDELADTAAALEELQKSSRLREVKNKIRQLGMRQLGRKSREAPAGALTAIREETARDMAGELVRAVAHAKEEERRKLDETRAEYQREREVLAGVVSFKDSLIAGALEETAALKARTDTNRKSMNSQLAEANAAGKALAQQITEAMQEELELQRQLSEAAIAKERTAAAKMKVGSIIVSAAHKSRAKAASYDRDVALARQRDLAEELVRAHRAVDFLRSEIVRADVKRGWDSAESRAVLDAEFERRLKGYDDDARGEEEEEGARVAPTAKPNLGWQAPGAAARGGGDAEKRGVAFVYFIFGFMTLSALSFLVLFVPETQGKTVDEVFGMQHFPVDTFSEQLPPLEASITPFIHGVFQREQPWLVFSPHALAQNSGFLDVAY